MGSVLGVKWTIGKPTRHTERVFSMVSRWRERIRAFLSQFTFDSAERVRKGVQNRIPKSARWKRYRKDLTTSRVSGGLQGTAAYTVHLNAKTSEVRKSDSERTVINVFPRGKEMFVPAKVRVLAQYSPWAADMLPFNPDLRTAKVVSRRVSTGEVKAVRKTNEKTKPTWRTALAKAGAAEKNSRLKTKTSKSLKAMPAEGFAALRMQHGVGGEKKVDHWMGPLVQETRRTITSMARTKNKFVKAFTDPLATEWMAWPTKTRTQVPKTYLSQFDGFQKGLGFKVG